MVLVDLLLIICSERLVSHYQFMFVSVQPETESPESLFQVSCTDLEYERLKNNLIDYHCARIGETECHIDDNSKAL